MANNAQAGAAVGVGEIFNTTDLTTFTGHSATGELPGAMLYVGAAGTGTAPTSVTNANPLPISDAGGSITVDSATFATSANQVTELASLASIDGKLPALVGGLVPITIAGQTGTVTVGVSGTVAVSGPLTDAQLRATAVPVSGTIAFSNTTLAVTNAGTFVVQATLAAETTKVIGTVNIAAAQTVAVTNAGTFAVQAVCINAGTFAVQIDSGAVTSLALIDDVIFVDDVAFTPEASKVVAIGMQADETATDSVNEGDIGCPRMTLDRKARVVDTPHTAGGLSVSSFLSTAAVQSTAVKASPGQVYAVEFFNIGSTPMYVRLYNQTGAPAGGDNANIVWRGIIPGNTAGAGFVKTWDKGLEFTTGIGMRCTGAIADTDTTVLAANTVVGNVEFK